MSSPRATVFTLALGRRFYLDLGINLARSFLRFHDPADVRFCIVTDSAQVLPPDIAGCERILVEPGSLGTGFVSKLCVDRFSTGPTLLIDSDILIYEPLDRLLAACSGRTVAVAGEMVSSGEWFGDIATYCSRLGVPSIPKFNGGFYYFEAGPAASAVYETARGLANRYDELSLVRLRGAANEELAMAGAMAIHGLQALPDDGSYMADPMACKGPMKVDVLSGRRILVNPPAGSALHTAWNKFCRQSPTLVHFLAEHAELPTYRAEAKKLRLAADGWPDWAARLAANLSVLWPGRARIAAKDILRPMFRAIAGTRRVKPTQRE